MKSRDSFIKEISSDSQPVSEMSKWRTKGSLVNELHSNAKTIHLNAIRIATEQGKISDWIGRRRNLNKMADCYHPELVKLLQADSPPPADNWRSAESLVSELESSTGTIHAIATRIAEEHGKVSEWMQQRRVHNKTPLCYHPDLVKLIQLALDMKNFQPIRILTKELKSDHYTILEDAIRIATEHGKLKDWIKRRQRIKREAVFFHPDLVALLYASKMPEAGDWISAASLCTELKEGLPSIYERALDIANKHKKTDKWIQQRKVGKRSKPTTCYHPDLVALIRASNIPEIGNWRSAQSVGAELKRDKKTIRRIALEIAIKMGKESDWIQLRRTHGNLSISYHPDLVILLLNYFKINQDTVIKDLHKEQKLREEFEVFIKHTAEVTEENEDGGVDFKNLIRIFGSSCAVILLYELRPDFKSIPVEHVKQVLAEYLGSYLSIKYTFNLKDVVAAAKFLSNPSLRQAIYENVKADCLRFYFEQRKNGSRADAYQVIYNYLIESVDELGDDIPKVVEDMMLEVMDYYTSAIRDFHKPEKFVDKLSEGREFPDLHQRINMKELKDKKRMLIADEMGLGKSASVIMAKEQLGLGCALVVVPGSVIKLGTWQNYLCDDPERKGYFRAGTAPRVLVVESPKQLEGLKKEQYDYIIVSHERLNGRYATLLADLDPDMLIVDEVHKLKDLKGVRSRSLMPLVNKLGPDKYLALLSGTPIPNKVRDIAFVLKLIYPEQFGQMQDGDLVKTIIQSSADEILKMLIPRMQMKELEDVVEMPRREQRVVDVKMSKVEADVYEGLLELDELTAKEKMSALRKFLMNPALLDSTPAYEGSKFVALRSELQEFFKTKSKVIVFVNEYITGVLRGQNAVLVREQLGLPDDVAVEHFYGGEENVRQRAGTQHRFNNTSERMAVLISGKTSDVGNSFVAAEETLVYSEPWTEADLRQQLARVFRPGLDHDIVEKIFVVGGTIEQGVHEYIRHKYKIIEKVLKGIPTTELEQRLLKKGEGEKDDAGIGDRIDFEVNPELARTYFSWKQKLDQFFGHTKENGEERIIEFLKQWGADYAQGYQEMGARSYQSNVNRVAGSFIGDMVAASGRHPAAIQILDIASGPEMLRRHIGTQLQPNVSSIDINPHHFANSTSGRARVASWTNIPCKPHTIDYVNCAMAFQDSSFAPARGMYERVNVLREMNRVLKIGGRAVISMIYSMRMADMDKFTTCMAALGFMVVHKYSGLATQGDDFESQIITIEKFADCEKTPEQVIEFIGQDNVVGLKFAKLEDKKLKKPRKVVRQFYLDGVQKDIALNDLDRTITHEEESVEKNAKDLCLKFGSVKNIPAQDVIKNGYIRVFVYGRYHLFKRLTTAPGVIAINDSVLK